jgi:hypothetical protein
MGKGEGEGEGEGKEKGKGEEYDGLQSPKSYKPKISSSKETLV